MNTDRNANVGRMVTWTTYPGCSSIAPKTGEIVAYVPARVSLREIQYDQAASEGVAVNVDAVDFAPQARYLVRVDRKGARGQRLTPRWYAPHASVIDRALGATEEGTPRGVKG